MTDATNDSPAPAAGPSEETWDEIMRLALDASISISSIARQFDVGRNNIYDRAKTRRIQLPSRVKRTPARKRAAAKRRKQAVDFADRLHTLALRNIEKLESFMDNDDTQLTPADGERISRLIGSTGKNVEKLKELASSNVDGVASHYSPADVERMCNEIADRLERMQRSRDSRG